MKRHCFLLGILLFFGACQSPSTRPKLTISVASNMQFAVSEIAGAFTEKTKTPVDLIIGSSGKLTAQITEGAPYDVFLSADLKYPQQLYQNRLAVQSPKVYAYGKLVLWTHNENVNPTIQGLTDETITHIALANPKTAPYGSAAIEVLKHHGIYGEVSQKLVFGESISQTNQFIMSEAAQVGFTAKSVVLSSNLKEKGKWSDVDSSDYTPIAQGIVLLNENRETKAFYTFIFSEEAKKILKNYGYSVDE